MVHSSPEAIDQSQVAKLHDDTGEALCAIATAYKFAVYVYVHIALDRVEDLETTDVAALCRHRVRTMLAYTKSGAIDMCNTLTTTISEESPLAVGLAPLLFVIAAESDNAVQADAALLRLDSLWQQSRLGNIGTAVELLNRVRQDGATSWRDVLAEQRWDLIVS